MNKSASVGGCAVSRRALAKHPLDSVNKMSHQLVVREVGGAADQVRAPDTAPDDYFPSSLPLSLIPSAHSPFLSLLHPS